MSALPTGRAPTPEDKPPSQPQPPHHRASLVPPAWAEAGAVVTPHARSRAGPSPPGLPPHHAGDGTFRNPWTSYVDHGPLDFFTKALPELRRLSTYALPVRPPPWAAVAAPDERAQVLWVGHATWLVQVDGFNVLTDPMFSRRASPSQLGGPARYTPPACTVDALPPVDVVVLSHNHYDHLDAGSVASLLRKSERDVAAAAAGGADAAAPRRAFRGTEWVCPLNVSGNLRALGVPRDRIVELDWWDTAAVGAAGDVVVTRRHGVAPPPPAEGAGDGAAAAAAPPPPLSVTAVPAQHQSARSMWDRNKTLWCGYVVEGGAAAAAGGARATRASVYFSGDTGFRSVQRGSAPFDAAEEAAPVCPAFAEIGGALGPFDIALLPIGAYSPRGFMSSFHASPEDAVRMHAAVRARRSVGMHWGTFALTDEPIEEPPLRLREAARRAGLAADAFVAVWPGSLVRAVAGPLDTAAGPAVVGDPVDPSAASASARPRPSALSWW